MPLSKLSGPIGPMIVALVLAVGLYAAPVSAQNQSGMGQSGTGSNPTAQAVHEQQLLQELNKIQGRVSIPNTAAGLLEQPQGRDYRDFREGWLVWIGAIAILGMLLALAVFYFGKGRMRMTEGYSGVKILRFNWFERFNHWMTATAFIVLAITGLNYVFGKRLLMPLMSPDAFATWSYWAKYAHNFVSWAFMVGVFFMLVIWIKDNMPDRYDWRWIREAGGFLRNTHPPAGRFNAGQKLIFWSVVLGGIALSVTGVIMLFPFSFTDINGMQLAQYVHAVVGMVMIAVILAHIYIGSLGMEGAYDAMGSGEVDLNWARAHHSAWVEAQEARVTGRPAATMAPAE